MIILSEQATFFFASLLSRGLLFKDRICPQRSKFCPLRVDPTLKGYFIQRSKQKLTQVNITLFPQKRQGAFSSAGAFIIVNTVTKFANNVDSGRGE